jgi:hypothetical protein
MAEKMSVEQLASYLTEQVKQIQAIEKEVDEIQVGYNTAYAGFKKEHDATLASLTDAVIAQYDAVLPALRNRIGERAAIEGQRIVERRKALREVEIPSARQEVDKRQRLGREAETARAKRNPLVDKREERTKATLAELTAQLEKLNMEIGRAGRGLGFITRYGSIVKLDQERNRVIGQVEATRKQINELRVEWKRFVTTNEADDARLQSEWQTLSVQAAELQAELDYLDDDKARAALTRRRAVNAVLDALNDPASYPDGALHDEIQQMIRLNIQTDNLQRGLGAVAGFIALLRGIAQGYGSFLASAEAILKEQSMHAAHLSKVTVSVPQAVLAFNEQWPALGQKVQDEKRLSKYPLEYVAAIQPALDGGLSRQSIDAMFTALGNELTRATRGWKG